MSPDGTLYSTLDIQNQVKGTNTPLNLSLLFSFALIVWSASDDFEIAASLISRSSDLQCQAFDHREPLLYLGTSVSTIKALHITEKRVVNEAIIDKYYPRIMYLYPYANQSKFLEWK